MKRYRVRLIEEAELDLLHIYRYVRNKSASNAIARNYVDRIRDFLRDFDTFPERGTVRSEIREGLRIVGFERRVSIAFVVEDGDVVVLRVLYGGQQLRGEPE